MAEEKSTAISPLKQFNLVLTNQKTKDYIDSVLGKNAELYVGNIVGIVSQNTSLQECEPMSVIYAGIAATSMRLSLTPSLGQAFIIPFNNRKENKIVATFQIGYKGLYQLALRTKQYKNIAWYDVREGELKNIDYQKNKITYQFEQDYSKRKNLKIIGYGCSLEFIWGMEVDAFMDIEDLEAHAKRYSQSYRGGFGLWKEDKISMFLKTILKLTLSKAGYLSPELERAIMFDNSQLDKETPIYVDNQPDLSENGQKFSDDMKAKFGTDVPATEYEEIKK